MGSFIKNFKIVPPESKLAHWSLILTYTGYFEIIRIHFYSAKIVIVRILSTQAIRKCKASKYPLLGIFKL